MRKQSIAERLSFFIKRKLLNVDFDSRKYWELRYQSNWNSGTGSYGENAEAKAQILNDLIQKYNIESIVEFGCGDGNNLQFYNIKKYLGLDVSSKTIQNCSQKYISDSSKSFMSYDPLAFHNMGQILNIDAAMSLDVIFHLVEETIFQKYMNDLFNLGKKYVFIYSSDHENNENSSIHVRHWNFTKYVKENIEGWELLDTIESQTKSGEQLNNWYVYKRSE